MDGYWLVVLYILLYSRVSKNRLATYHTLYTIIVSCYTLIRVVQRLWARLIRNTISLSILKDIVFWFLFPPGNLKHHSKLSL